MSDRLIELRAILADVRRRWERRALLRAWTLGASTATAVLLVGLLTVWLMAGDGVPLVIVAGIVLVVAVVSLVFALLPLRQSPTDAQVARFIEEQVGDLDDVLVTAVAQAARPDPIAGLLAADAVRAARRVDCDRVVTRETLQRAAVGAAVGSVALLIATAFFAPAAGRAGHVLGAYLLPTRYAIEVTPGSATVRAGQPLTIVARIPGIDGGLVPTVTVGTGAEARSARMTPGTGPGEFSITLNNIGVSFPYAVAAGGARSPEYTVTVIRPVTISRIDLRYEYPAGLGLLPHTESEGGDIYAPAGTKVRMTITTDKPVRQGQLTMADGTALPLAGQDRVLTTDLTIDRDGSYRVALDDVDGLASAGDTEYFIRMLDDRPPDVRILRPAGDKQVSPLEEVAIEARAEDDYGIASLELVFKTAAGRQTVVPLGGGAGALSASGLHTLFLEDLDVQPGDFVTYHARARDVGRGRRPSEARSDIFFLEVKPYEEEFVAAQSQGMAGMQGDQTGIEELVAAQKDIIAATWKLDARSRKTRDARSAPDIRAVAQAQTALKAKADEAARQLSRASVDARRRRAIQPGMGPGADDPMTRAVEAMGRAAGELDRLSTAQALPYEMDALNQLLRAAAEIRRRQVQQQAQGGGGNGNRQTPDLSTLFDQELRKRQQTNYETPTSSETRSDEKKAEDPLDGIRELARRQEALTRQQRELAKNREQLAEEEIQRQLERLTREQNELRQQAEQLTERMRQQSQQSQSSQNHQEQSAQNRPSSSPQGGQQGGQQGQGGQGSQGAGADSQRMREISEEMRNAATDLRRQDPQQASARGDKALQQLRSLEQQMQGSRPDERRRALGDLQLEARQLADAERRLGNEAARTPAGPAGDDARRRLAAEQDRLADRTDRLGESVRQIGKANADADQDQRQAVDEAARELDRQKTAERMRQSAQAMRQGTTPGAESPAKAEDVARGLDKVAERLGAATGVRDGDAERLSEQLARTLELRDRLSELQRSMDALARAGQAPEAQQAPGRSGQQGSSSPSSSSGEGRTGSTGQQGSGEGGRAGEIARLQREVNDQMRETQQLAEEVRRQNPRMQKGTSTPEEWSRSVSAPGTESFKQDFAKWESLKKNLVVALERTESQLSDQLRARENKERLNAGRHDAVADSYRELVDRYYQSLAAPRRPPR